MDLAALLHECRDHKCNQQAQAQAAAAARANVEGHATAGALDRLAVAEGLRINIRYVFLHAFRNRDPTNFHYIITNEDA